MAKQQKNLDPVHQPESPVPEAPPALTSDARALIAQWAKTRRDQMDHNLSQFRSDRAKSGLHQLGVEDRRIFRAERNVLTKMIQEFSS